MSAGSGATCDEASMSCTAIGSKSGVEGGGETSGQARSSAAAAAAATTGGPQQRGQRAENGLIQGRAAPAHPAELIPPVAAASTRTPSGVGQKRERLQEQEGLQGQGVATVSDAWVKKA